MADDGLMGTAHVFVNDDRPTLRKLKDFIAGYFMMPAPWTYRGTPRWQVLAALAWNYIIVALIVALIAYAAMLWIERA